ncbi:PaaI family thioesterase [Corynebacterium lowii]|uniref:Putative esterase n=1 Tax=Corynebacterium lowii TaxID=1544413 RepID=A0A0Q0UCQ9_9CORY|nr:PaaI family thioesterase [Corynebacterium lowii]KQB85705.1 putative esterase [Corynebacterium lowii]MDP9851006.1 uncharacterized protein (TIGR00369 family) [Corynebacterium lowii]
MDFQQMMKQAAQEPLDAAALDQINAASQGAEAALGIRFTAVGPEEVCAELEVDDRHKQPMGLVHGGIYCLLTEGVGSMAALVSTEGRPVVGVNNSTDFIRSVSSGVVTARATAIQCGRRTQLWDVQMRQGDRLLARGTLRTMTVG